MPKVLGLDCGIASVGWAVLEYDDIGVCQIIACGSYCFNQPIVGGTGKDRLTSLQSAKKQRLGHTHFLHRKKIKMNDLRRALQKHGLLDDAKSDSLARAMLRVSPARHSPQITPFDLRAKGLKELLTRDEFAVVIGNLVAHPGPRASEKSRSDTNETEKGVIKGAVHTNSLYRQMGYLTAGDMLARDPKFLGVKRNKEKDWRQSIGRNDVIFEIEELFRKQERQSNQYAKMELLNRILEILESRKLPDFDYYPVAGCRFIVGEKRAATRSFSYEKYRYAQSLSHLRIVREGPEQPSTEEIRAAMSEFGKQPKTTFKDLRKLWGLKKSELFAGVKDEKDRDFATAKGESAHGSHTLMNVLSDAWLQFATNHELLDQIAYEVSFATKEQIVEIGLQKLGLSETTVHTLMSAYREGRFDRFTKAGDVSAKAAHRLIPYLMDGKSYSDACKAENFDPTAKPVNIQENHNPVTKHAVKEYTATIDEIIAKFGVPDEIRIEMARDVAWSEAKKIEYTEALGKALRTNKNIYEECKEKIGGEPKGTQVDKYRFAKEQGFKCIYSGDDLCESMRNGFEGTEIDHILPESDFFQGGDKSNLVVCLTGRNANKSDSTPFEWSQRDLSFDWDTFIGRLKAMKELPKRKKYLLQLRATDEIKNGFKKRNLVDTQYAIKLLAAELVDYFERSHPSLKPPRIVGRPGRLVKWLRKGWQLNHFKYDLKDKRSDDDRHHAVDAIVVAAIDDRTIQIASYCAKANETSGRPRHHFTIDPPWPTMRADTERMIEAIPIVARAPKKTFGGKLHKDTLYGLTRIDGQLRKRRRIAVDKNLTLEHLKDFQDNSDKGHIKNILEQWIQNKHPLKDASGNPLPSWKYGLNPDGTERRMRIKKITLMTTETEEVSPSRLRSPTNKQGEAYATYDRAMPMIRVDVFRSEGPKTKARFVYEPVYAHQMNDELPPAHELSRQFIFSLNLFDLVEIYTRNATDRMYFRGLDIDSDRLEFTPLLSVDKSLRQRFSPSKVLDLKKLVVSRIGKIEELKLEPRTWRGKVCISPNLQG